VTVTLTAPCDTSLLSQILTQNIVANEDRFNRPNLGRLHLELAKESKKKRGNAEGWKEKSTDKNFCTFSQHLNKHVRLQLPAPPGHARKPRVVVINILTSSIVRIVIAAFESDRICISSVVKKGRGHLRSGRRHWIGFGQAVCPGRIPSRVGQAQWRCAGAVGERAWCRECQGVFHGCTRRRTGRCLMPAD